MFPFLSSYFLFSFISILLCPFLFSLFLFPIVITSSLMNINLLPVALRPQLYSCVCFTRPWYITLLKWLWLRSEPIQVQTGRWWHSATDLSVQSPMFPPHWTSKPTGRKPCHFPHQMRGWKMSHKSSHPASFLLTLLVQFHSKISYINQTSVQVYECTLVDYYTSS